VEGAAGAEVALARASAAALAAARLALRLDMMMIGCGLNRAPNQTWWSGRFLVVTSNNFVGKSIGGRSLWI
jgi:hypothetical protein